MILVLKTCAEHTNPKYKSLRDINIRDLLITKLFRSHFVFGVIGVVSVIPLLFSGVQRIWQIHKHSVLHKKITSCFRRLNQPLSILHEGKKNTSKKDLCAEITKVVTENILSNSARKDLKQWGKLLKQTNSDKQSSHRTAAEDSSKEISKSQESSLHEGTLLELWGKGIITELQEMNRNIKKTINPLSPHEFVVNEFSTSHERNNPMLSGNKKKLRHINNWNKQPIQKQQNLWTIEEEKESESESEL